MEITGVLLLGKSVARNYILGRWRDEVLSSCSDGPSRQFHRQYCLHSRRMKSYQNSLDTISSLHLFMIRFALLRRLSFISSIETAFDEQS